MDKLSGQKSIQKKGNRYMNRFQKWIIDKHPCLGTVLYAIKHSRDPEYRTKAMQIDPNVFRFRELGDSNPDRNIYYIVMGDRGDGFFAEYGRLLMYLYVSDRYNLTPVVRFTEDYLYTESVPVNGYENPFQYYFLEPGGIDPEEAERSRNVVFSEFVHTLNMSLMKERQGLYGYTDNYINIMGGIQKKYIRLNPIVKKYISENVEKILGSGKDRIIGVHFRGTDYKRGLDGHPVYTAAKEQIEKAGELLGKGNYDKIFLATDDSDALQEFKDEFGDKLVFYDDVFRGTGDTSVAFSRGERELHHYKLGLEVLRDMETLSECGALIAGPSQVSLAARITKAAENRKYRDLIIIDKGTVVNGRNAREYYEASL